ncbi:MAG TPA: heavy metal-binding domain-containing protein, partial [Vicinamibacteria bacterium]|nr:heavy metal-binding domain-containing protein [Vicinamibacteria bacterium]
MTTVFLVTVQLLQPDDARESFEVWLCPLHRDEQAVGPAACPICERPMVKRLLVSSYSCPMHPHIDREEPGTCNICYMDLVAMTRELQWYCPDDPREVSAVPGSVCSKSGDAMALRTIPMAHGDHNPRHGGILFMAPDRYHHLEGVLSPEGAFRLYFYDDFTEPMDASDFHARIGAETLR